MKKLLMKKQVFKEAINSYLDEYGIIRVGRRLDKFNLSNECKHLIASYQN